MQRRSLLGVAAMCVCMAMRASGALAATADIVLYAADATNLHGNWSRVADASAAGGQLLSSANNGWETTNTPLAAPANFFDFTFSAPSATAYHVWLRMRATGNSKFNDSVYLQYSDAIDASGAPLFRLGTTTGVTVNLAPDSTNKGLSGWGWQDGAYWLTQTQTLRFATTGAHTLRIQTREDGVQIDQVVLSPASYLTTAPGQASNDATILPRTPASTALPAPWTSQDVGSTGQTGSASYASGVFTVAGAGADIWGSADAFQFVSQSSTGDVQIVARVTAEQNTNTYAKAGVMLRETTAAGSAHVVLDVRPNGSIEFMTRSATGGATSYIAGATQATPAWLKLLRSGGTVTGSVSADGSTWTTVGTTPSTMAATAAIGLAVTSHDTTQLNTSTFDNVTVAVPLAPPAVPTTPAPAASATGVATNVSLSWSAAGATSYDVRFGTTNPPAGVANGITSSSYSPAGLAAGTNYFWQIVARNAAGVTTGPVWSFATIVAAPTAPVAVAPANGATNVATTAALAWSSTGATSYDVAFGTTNPPGSAVAGLTAATFAPATLANGTTYFWQVTARNAGGSTTGAVSSFTTAATTTALPAPWSGQDVGATGLAGSSSFTNGVFTVAGAGADIWGAADAFRLVSQPTSGDAQIVARVAAIQNTNTYAKAGVMLRETSAAGSAHVILDVRPDGSIEFMTRPTTGAATTFIAGGTQVTPTWLKLARSGGTVTASISADGTSWTTIGSISTTMSATALIGVAVTSHDTTQLNTATLDNVAVTVPAVAPPGVPTSPTPAAGATGVALSALLAWTAAGATSYDVNFGTANPPAPAASGVATASYTAGGLTAGTTYFWQVVAHNSGGTATGPVWSFATFVATPPPGPTPGVSPTAYNAITDRNTYVKPALPALGAAGYTFNDPTFGSKIMRATDGNTRPGVVNRSYRVPSNAHLDAWNTTSTMFYVLSNDGTSIPYTFDPTTMSASRIQASASGDGGMTFNFYGEPQFSVSNANLIYGVARGGNNHTIAQYDFGAGVYSNIIDLETIASVASGTYVGGMMTADPTNEKVMTFFGGVAQDYHFYLLWMPFANPGARKLIDTHASTINGARTSTTLNFSIHSASIDKSGRYVMIYPTGPDLGAPRYAAHVYVWDTQTDAIVPMTNGTNGTIDMHNSGHDAAGYGYSVNHDCCTSTAWDGMQFEFRYLSDIATTFDLINPLLTPKEIYIDDHTNWNNARPDAMVPVISSTYRYGTNTTAWRAWDDEIIGIDTTNGTGGVVYRFAHHRSNSASDTDPTTPYFWYEPIANVSPNGRFVLFTSNWEKTLGTDASEGTARQDVFIVQLTPQ